MAALGKCCRLLRPISLNYGRLATPSRAASYWNKDWMPGPYPKTAEERAAAAKKYGMQPEDYEPYPADDAHGDYPKLPFISKANHDPFEDYDIPHLERNYGEPVNRDADVLLGDRIITPRKKLSDSTILLVLFGYVGGLLTIYYLLEPYKLFRPVMPKQLVGQGPHYTFEQE